MVVLLDTIRGSNTAIPQELLYKSDSIQIWYEAEIHWLYVEWMGALNLHNVQRNGQILLQFLKEKQCAKILNNNQQVQGPWLDACSYAAEELLPQLIEAGLKYLAWVQSPNPYSQYSMEQTLEATSLPIKNRINIFYSLPVAREWLKNV
ncbi:hypothetical protein AHMF7605_14950 [Adhaeribacter arboris]|uniref:STAS/SEC14 domain-containing protein n=1 Tax=Adhaeribacter arboris TaxID=2072846 RepID=A0A2T2YGT4_9BACT|nr:hypothetical protein [Adhaeribacter arboris]PSR54713.1 hypothetical protein AHMF7605_14950 [Adhaeribacter arboris]